MGWGAAECHVRVAVSGGIWRYLMASGGMLQDVLPAQPRRSAAACVPCGGMEVGRTKRTWGMKRTRGNENRTPASSGEQAAQCRQASSAGTCSPGAAAAAAGTRALVRHRQAGWECQRGCGGGAGAARGRGGAHVARPRRTFSISSLRRASLGMPPYSEESSSSRLIEASTVEPSLAARASSAWRSSAVSEVARAAGTDGITAKAQAAGAAESRERRVTHARGGARMPGGFTAAAPARTSHRAREDRQAIAWAPTYFYPWWTKRLLRSSRTCQNEPSPPLALASWLL